MLCSAYINIPGLDIDATCAQIGKLINESGLNDKQLGRIMNLSVQSINKWRHGHNLPDIENMYILSRILGKSVDDFLIPSTRKRSILEIEIEIETEQNPVSIPCRLKKYAVRTRECSLNGDSRQKVRGEDQLICEFSHKTSSGINQT